MRRAALIFFLLQAFLLPSNAQDDVRLIRDADFSAQLYREQAPEGANACETAMYHLYKQLTGRDFYDPPNYMFLRSAVKTLGFFPGVLATLDRILRDSKLGTATSRLDPEHPVIYEGPEAYLPEKRRRSQ
jgi:hypothetical protein